MKYKEIRKKILSIAVVTMLVGSNVVYAAQPVKKDESVYANLTAQGEKKQIIVSDWLHSDEAGVKIKDKSILKSIKNIKGEETPKREKGTLLWKSDENDIFYQGKTTKDLPIEVQITYFLDGKQIQPNRLSGKSGHVKMRIQLKNKDAHRAEVNGKNKTIYTPFTVAAIINLPLDHFANVKASTGEIVSDANNQVITFVGFPGLQESLGLDKDILEIPDEITIEADTKEFKMGSIMMVATPKLPDMENFEGAEDLDQLVDSIEKMENAAAQLSQGADKLAQGQTQLEGGIEDLASGISQLKDASGQINNGAFQLSEGTKSALDATSQLSNGVNAMGEGVKQFSSSTLAYGKGAQDYAKGAKEFSDGTAQLTNQLAPFTGKLQQLDDGLKKMVENTPKMIQGQQNITQGAQKGIEGAENLKNAKSQQDAALQSISQGLDKTIHDLEGVEGAQESVQELMKYKQALEEINSSAPQFNQGLDGLQNGYKNIQSGSAKLTEGLNELQKGQKAVSTEVSKVNNNIGELKSTVEKFSEGSKNLTKGANELYKNAQLLNNGAQQFTAKSKDLNTGFHQYTQGIFALDKGASDLYNGTKEFYGKFRGADKGAEDLYNGAKQLSSGSKELAVNMNKFKEEAVDKMADKVNKEVGNLEEILASKDEIVKLSKDYDTFSGLDDKMEGNVKFIMKTDEIETSQTQETKKVENHQEKESFIDRLKSLFNKLKSLFNK